MQTLHFLLLLRTLRLQQAKLLTLHSEQILDCLLLRCEFLEPIVRRHGSQSNGLLCCRFNPPSIPIRANAHSKYDTSRHCGRDEAITRDSSRCTEPGCWD